jgi:hypothetical protein
MRRFKVRREEDEGGISGIGIVAEGVEFEDGGVVMKWLSHKSTITFFANIKHLKDIHGHGGRTKIVWIDPDPLAGIERTSQ